MRLISPYKKNSKDTGKQDQHFNQFIHLLAVVSLCLLYTKKLLTQHYFALLVDVFKTK